MANMWDYLSRAAKVHRGFVEGANPQFAQAQASRRQAKSQELNQQLNLLGKLPQGSPRYQQLANEIMQRPEFQSLKTQFGEGGFTAPEKPQTPLQEQQTRATSGLADIREQELTEMGKPDLWKFLNEAQDIQAKYRKEELTEDAARAGMSLLAQKSPELSKLSGIFDLPEREKEPLTSEEQREAALIGGKLKLGVQPPEKDPTKTQLQAKEIQRLQAIPKEQRTQQQQARLDKMLIGQPLVEIGFGKPASASERTAIAEGRASIDSLNNLKMLFDSKQTKTGPITGRVSPIAGLVGMTTDEQEAFMAATSAFKNAVIKQITGAQMSETEANRIMKQVPDITDPPVRWKAKWEQTMRNVKMLERRRLQVLGQSGLRVPSGETVVVPPEIHNMSDELERVNAEIAELEAKQ